MWSQPVIILDKIAGIRGSQWYLTKSPDPQNPVQEWGEESEDGAVYGITLHRVPVPSSPSSPSSPSGSNPSGAFVQYRTNKVRRLKAARLQMLVHHLLDADRLEQDYGRIFLSTYRTFTSTAKLLELIFQR